MKHAPRLTRLEKQRHSDPEPELLVLWCTGMTAAETEAAIAARHAELDASGHRHYTLLIVCDDDLPAEPAA